MKWNNKFNYPKSSSSIENGMRKYLFDDEKLPSVTSILQATKSDEDKAALENWKQRVGYTEANKIKNEASNRGTSLHSYIEDFLRGRINESFFESNENYKNMAKEIIDKGIKGKLEEKLFEWLDQNNNIEEKKNTIDRNKKTTKVASKEKKVKPKKQKS